MKRFSKPLATSIAIIAILNPAVAQEKTIKLIASPPIPRVAEPPVPAATPPSASTTTKAPTIPSVQKKAPQKQAAPEKPKAYVVQSGDNPWLIAKNHGISLEALMAANKIKDAKNLKIGDVLILPKGTESRNAPAPDRPKAAGAPEAKTAQSTAEGASWVLYTIQKGDNPWNISKALKVNHQKIISLNEGTDFTKLSIGQQIKVPKPAGE